MEGGFQLSSNGDGARATETEESKITQRRAMSVRSRMWCFIHQCNSARLDARFTLSSGCGEIRVKTGCHAGSTSAHCAHQSIPVFPLKRTYDTVADMDRSSPYDSDA